MIFTLDNVPNVILSASILVINDPTPTKLVLAVIIPDELICLTCFMSSLINILDGSLLLSNVPDVILSASILVINDPTPTKSILAVIIPVLIFTLDNVPNVILSASILVISDPSPSNVDAVIIPDELICLTCFMSSRIYTFPLFIAVPPFVDVGSAPIWKSYDEEMRLVETPIFVPNIVLELNVPESRIRLFPIVKFCPTYKSEVIEDVPTISRLVDGFVFPIPNLPSEVRVIKKLLYPLIQLKFAEVPDPMLL